MHTNLFGPSAPPEDSNTIKGVQIGGGKALPHKVRRGVDPSKILSLFLVDERKLETVALRDTEQLFFVPDATQDPFIIDGKTFEGYGYVIGWKEEEFVDTSIKPEEISFIVR
jgi:hypothetical protein